MRASKRVRMQWFIYSKLKFSIPRINSHGCYAIAILIKELKKTISCVISLLGETDVCDHYFSSHPRFRSILTGKSFVFNDSP